VTPADAVRIGKVVLVLQRDWDSVPKTDADGTAHMKTSSTEPTTDLEIGGQAVVVRAESMQKILSLAARVAQTNMSVLVLGETGSGKEIIARAIHERSNRRTGAFLGLNCAALTEALLESELFGHERGAFTGAHAAKIGLFEKAAGGTVFLDEIGDMSLAIQAKLLRVFEERNVLRLGSLEARPIDVRFVTATNKNLAAEVAAGRFRKDFLFRLSGVTLHVPPLRERLAEIEPLAALFLARAAREGGRALPAISPDALEKLTGHPWPGNIRELKHVMERALLMSEGGQIEARHIELLPTHPDAHEPGPDDSTKTELALRVRPPASSLKGELDSLERTRIVEALEKAGGNQTRAAELLGIPRRTFLRKLDQFDIKRPRRP
jgi:DNA-binding NtrC family response regulator